MSGARVCGAAVIGFACLVPAGTGPARADEPPALLPFAKCGTRFEVEVIESIDAAYLGDTPGDMGRGGDLAVRSNVAPSDDGYRTLGEMTIRIGTIPQVRWKWFSGGLTVEFEPVPLVRIAVGEAVWIDLNPAPAAAASPPAPER